MSTIKVQADKAKSKFQGQTSAIPDFTVRDYSSFFLAGQFRDSRNGQSALSPRRLTSAFVGALCATLTHGAMTRSYPSFPVHRAQAAV